MSIKLQYKKLHILFLYVNNIQQKYVKPGFNQSFMILCRKKNLYMYGSSDFVDFAPSEAVAMVINM